MNLTVSCLIIVLVMSLMNKALWFNFLDIDNYDYLIEGILYNKKSKRLAYILAHDKPITKILLEM